MNRMDGQMKIKQTARLQGAIEGLQGIQPLQKANGQKIDNAVKGRLREKLDAGNSYARMLVQFHSGTNGVTRSA